MKNLRCNAVVWIGIGLSLLGTGYGSSRSTSASSPAGAVLTLTPNPASAIIGTRVQFTAMVAGAATSAVTWSVTAPPGSSASPGEISSIGLYTTPYPAPATVTVKAVSTQNPALSGSVTVILSPPAAAAGPALTVDVSRPGNRINPDIYGVNAIGLHLSSPIASKTGSPFDDMTVARWGGDSRERYNYKLDVTSQVLHSYFENKPGIGGYRWTVDNGVTAFDKLVMFDSGAGLKTMGTVPVLGWVAKDATSCSFPVATYPGQQRVDSIRGCGNGIYPAGVNGCANPKGCNITGNDPTVTSIPAPPPVPPAPGTPIGPSWTGDWVTYLVNKFGPGNPPGGSGHGVAIYGMDNEPYEWDNVDKDVHPLPFTYDELTNGEIGTALAIKTADPTALVTGPVLGVWWYYFYSGKDVASGLATGPCHQPWSNPVDRAAHGGVPFAEYYLQQFAAAETKYDRRLLDYLDTHAYISALYSTGSGDKVRLKYNSNTRSNTIAQMARLNSTRVFWDPTYNQSDPTFNEDRSPEPNYSDNPSSLPCATPRQEAPELIRRLKSWISADYPGTKLAITEYSWGGMEDINGALAETEILGIFGREGVDLATVWPASADAPGMKAFEIYRNYDGKKSMFGDTVLPSNSGAANTSQSTMSIYGAVRSTDGAVTVVVINKTYGDLTSTLALTGLSSKITSAQVYLYSNANLSAITEQPAITVKSESRSSTISYTFPAQSITLFVLPQP